MGANDTQYIPSKEFQEGILDKETGLPLDSGKVYAYKDTDRTITGIKPLYKKVENAPENTYEEIPTDVNGAIILSSIGTFNDCGSDIIPYFYPYDENGNFELYYIRVTDKNDVDQFTRFAVPNLSEETPDDEIEETNYVPNGQFSSHNDVPLVDDTKDEGEITEDVTEIAPGNWTFERSSGSAAKDIVLFDRFASATSNPTGNPRYAVRIKCENPDAGDTVKGLRLKFRDVNKFTSPEGQLYNFSFSAKTNLGGQASITIKGIKNYGTGGDAEEEFFTEAKTITNAYDTYFVNIDFGNNAGKTIGDNDDDFVMLEIAFPPAILFDNSFTDFVLMVGAEQPINYPLRTLNQDNYKSLAGSTPIPRYAGQDLYLPVINTPNGFAFDDSIIGKIFIQSIRNLSIGELFCNGEKYLTNGYSTDGIPYQRLFDKLWDSNYLITLYGSGKTFVNAFPFNLTYPMDINKIKVYENSFGDTTSATDGSIATGFTFNDEQTGEDYETVYIFSVQTVAGSSITEGAYWKFYVSQPATPSYKKYLVWYSKLATSTPPTETADKKIKVLYDDSDSDKDIARKTLIAINQFYYSVPDYRGKFLRINDRMQTIGYNDLDANESVVGIYKVRTRGSGYVAGDIVEIPGTAGGAPLAKVKILAVTTGQVDKVLLVENGYNYVSLGVGRHDDVATSGGTGTGLKLDIEIGENRASALNMEESPNTFFGRYEVGSYQEYDTSGTVQVKNTVPSGFISPGSHYPADDESTVQYGGNPTAYFAHDSLVATRNFNTAGKIVDGTAYTPNEFVEFGHGHETRPKNNYVMAVIKY